MKMVRVKAGGENCHKFWHVPSFGLKLVMAFSLESGRRTS
jgi:hypothetical protein